MYFLSVPVVFSSVHEVGREQGVLTISVVFSIVHKLGREQRGTLSQVQ